MNRPRVLLADDYRMLREAFAQLLESHYDVIDLGMTNKDAAQIVGVGENAVG